MPFFFLLQLHEALFLLLMIAASMHYEIVHYDTTQAIPMYGLARRHYLGNVQRPRKFNRMATNAQKYLETLDFGKVNVTKTT